MSTMGRNGCAPCPFCGVETLEILRLLDDIEAIYIVVCPNKLCGATGPRATTEQDAIDKWNMQMRSGQTQKQSGPPLLRITSYGVCADDSIEGLQRRVMAFLVEGYEPLSALQMIVLRHDEQGRAHILYAQPVVRRYLAHG